MEAGREGEGVRLVTGVTAAVGRWGPLFGLR